MASAKTPQEAELDFWRHKVVELSSQSDDFLIPTIGKAFDLLAVIGKKDHDPVTLQRALITLDCEITTSLQLDKNEDPVRALTYGLLKCVRSAHIPKDGGGNTVPAVVTVATVATVDTLAVVEVVTQHQTGPKLKKPPAKPIEELNSEQEKEEEKPNVDDNRSMVAEAGGVKRRMVDGEERQVKVPKFNEKQNVKPTVVASQRDSTITSRGRPAVRADGGNGGTAAIMPAAQPPDARAISGPSSNELHPRKRGEASTSTPIIGKTQPTPKTQSINDRLRNEFSLPNTQTIRTALEAEQARSREVSEATKQTQLATSSATVSSSKAAAKQATRAPFKRRPRRFQLSSSSYSSEDDEPEESAWLVACICGQTDDDGEEMVACDTCIRFEHADCIFPRTKERPTSYTCHTCAPRPTELTPAQAREYQDGVKKQKKLQAAKKEQEISRKPQSSRHTIQYAASKSDKPAKFRYRNIEMNEYSASAKRHLAISRSSLSSVTLSSDVVKTLINYPKAKPFLVQPNTYGLIAPKPFTDGDYIGELCGFVSLQNECLNRDAPPGSGNDQTFLFEKDGVKLIIDARKCGNYARYVRRSCKPNAELQDIMSGSKNASELHLMIRATTTVEETDEVKIGLEPDWNKQPRSATNCTCGGEELKTCVVELFFNQKGNKMSSAKATYDLRDDDSDYIELE